MPHKIWTIARSLCASGLIILATGPARAQTFSTPEWALGADKLLVAAASSAPAELSIAAPVAHPPPDDPWLIAQLVDALLRVNVGAAVWSESEFASEVLRRDLTLFLEARAQRANEPGLTWEVVHGFRDVPLVQRELHLLTKSLNGTELVAAAYLWAFADLAGSHCPTLIDAAMEQSLDPIIPVLCDRSSAARQSIPSLESLHLSLPGPECALTNILHSLDRQMVAMQKTSVATMSRMMGSTPAALHTSKIGAVKSLTQIPAQVLSRVAEMKSRAASFTLELERWRLKAVDPNRAADVERLTHFYLEWSQSLDQLAVSGPAGMISARGVQAAESMLDLLEMVAGLSGPTPGAGGPDWAYGFNERVMRLAIQCGAGHSPSEAKTMFEHFAPQSKAFPNADEYPAFDLASGSVPP